MLVVGGRKQFAELIEGHAGLVSHTGILGGGPGQGFSLEPILTALSYLPLALPFAMVLATICLTYVTYAQWQSRTVDSLAPIRDRAMEKFLALGLPTGRDETWRSPSSYLGRIYQEAVR